jgi:hypothetical protein
MPIQPALVTMVEMVAQVLLLSVPQHFQVLVERVVGHIGAITFVLEPDKTQQNQRVVRAVVQAELLPRAALVKLEIREPLVALD